MGRIAIGRGVQCNTTFRPKEVEKIDEWAASQAMPLHRTKAIRQLTLDMLAIHAKRKRKRGVSEQSHGGLGT